MIRRTAGYVAAVLVTVYLFFMYDAVVLSGVVIFFFLYPVAAWIYLAALGRRAEVTLERVPPLGEKGRRIRAGITVRNTSARMSIRYELKAGIGNSSAGKHKKRRFRGVIAPRKEATEWITFETEYCGRTEIILDTIKIYDFLGVFYRRVSCRKTAQIKVMPEFQFMPLEITRRTREFQADAQEFSQEKRGDDPSEIYQIREYRERDSLKDIHWKLSAREGKLMIKERSFPLGCVVLLYIDDPKGKQTAAGFSKMLETVASISITLVSEKCVHMAAWYEEKSAEIVRWRVSDEESAYDMVWSLMETEPYEDRRKAEVCYDDTFRGQEFAAVITVDGNGRIRKDGEDAQYLRL